MAVPLPTLDAVTIATPCHVPWAGMRGDDRSRFCGECRRPVFDLTTMTTAEAAALLADPGGRPCVRLYRRPDGRVMTADCPVGLRGRVWRRVRRRTAWMESLFAVLFLPACRTVMQGLPGDALKGVTNDTLPRSIADAPQAGPAGRNDGTVAPVATPDPTLKAGSGG